MSDSKKYEHDPRFSRLTAFQQRFVEIYLKNGCKNAKAAYIEAGGGAKYAACSAHTLIHKNKMVKEAIAKASAEFRESMKFSYAEAIEEIDRRIKRADEAGQHNAVASLMQLKLKASGLLIEKHQVESQSRVLIQISTGDEREVSPSLPSTSPSDLLPPATSQPTIGEESDE